MVKDGRAKAGGAYATHYSTHRRIAIGSTCSFVARRLTAKINQAAEIGWPVGLPEHRNVRSHRIAASNSVMSARSSK